MYIVNRLIKCDVSILNMPNVILEYFKFSNYFHLINKNHILSFLYRALKTLSLIFNI